MGETRARGIVSRAAGPVIELRTTAGAFAMNEAVAVGPQGLLGEVLQVRGEVVTAQVYEDTSGLRPGVAVEGAGRPLSVALGPALLGGIFDGLLRPLAEAGTHWIAPGLFREETHRFRFEGHVRAGERLEHGATVGTIRLPGDRSLPCRLSPGVAGQLRDLVADGDYPDREVLAVVVDDSGREHPVTMVQHWPVRTPRPAAARLPLTEPLFTGQRIVDAVLPVARGGKAALPGGFGTGKTILLQSLAKWCDADVIVYIGCGERGNEMTSVLEEFPQLEDPRRGRPLMERSVIIANTSNMPVAAREASIYTGVTVAEYFRDLGLHAAVFADSTSRWAEALREISGRLGELPAEGGYPAYLGSRKAEFYERAARVRTLSGDEGSVTVVGAVSPPGGDFSEPVTLYTQRNVPCFWPLDRDRARARFFPAIDPLGGYSEYADELASWWRREGHAGWLGQRRRFLELLEEQDHLSRMARIVGKDALPAEQQATLLCAELINECFLRQSAFSPVDRHASAGRQAAMMDALIHFVDAIRTAVADGASIDRITALPVLRRLRRMSEELGEDAVPAGFDALKSQLDRAVAELLAEEEAS